MPKEKKPCYQYFINKTTESLDILLHDEIGFWGTQSKDFVKLLSDNKDRDIDLDINSPGGSVVDGFSIYNALKSHPKNVTVKISGIAASIAAFIALAAKKSNRYMSENSMIMFHSPYMGAYGTVEEIENQLEALKRFKAQITNTLDKNSSLESTEIEEKMGADWWMLPEEAIEAGLIKPKNVTEKVEISNKFDLKSYNFQNVPENAIKLVDSNYQEPKMGLFTRVKNNYFKTQPDEDKMSKEQENNINDRFEALDKRIEDLETSNEEKQNVIDTQKKTIENLENKLEKMENESQVKIVEETVQKYIDAGKVKPVDKEFHIENMKRAYNENDTTAFDAYEKYLDSLEKIVDLSGDHKANKGDASDKSTKIEELIEKEIDRIMDKDSNITYAQASRQARDIVRNKNQ